MSEWSEQVFYKQTLEHEWIMSELFLRNQSKQPNKLFITFSSMFYRPP